MPLLKRQPKKLIRVSEAAQQLGCDTRTAKKLFKVKRLTEGRTSPFVMFKRDLDEYLAKQTGA